MSTESGRPKSYSYQGNVSISLKPAATMSFGYLQSGMLKSDLSFIVARYRDKNNEANERNIFARNAIVLMAFYFECLSNSLFSEKDDSWKVVTKKYSHISKPIRKFIAKYEVENGGSYNLDHMGMQDLFSVRNKVFAHAPEATILKSNKLGEITKLAYRKFVNLPHSFIDFGERHADIFLGEMNTFLVEYTKLMKSSLPDWWLREYDK